MSTSVSHFSETDLNIRNKKQKKNTMDTISYFPETDLDIRFTQKKKKKKLQNRF